jgi:thiamine-phosphate pyrophosphorylase
MKSRKRSLKKSHLYLILDKKFCFSKSILKILDKIKGCDIIQLRDKESKRQDILKEAFLIRKFLNRKNVLFIINDYLDIAKIVDSDGLHIGQYDTSIEIARKVLGKHKIIGVSCHNLKQALDARRRGADYISIGPIFSTPIKPEYKLIGINLVKKIKQRLKIPFFAIGGINQDNISILKSIGAKRVAICRAILQAKDISKTIKYFSKILKEH